MKVKIVFFLNTNVFGQYHKLFGQYLSDIKKSYLYMDKAAGIILKLIDKQGTINVGGEVMSPFEFAKQSNPNIEKISLKDIGDVKMGKNASMNISKMKNILNEL